MLQQNGAAHAPSSNSAPFCHTQPTLWQPAIPFIEHRLPPYGRLVDLYRLARVAWVLLLLPLHLALWTTTLLPLPRALRPPSWLLPGTDTRWTRSQQLLLPPLKRLIWSITDVGGAPKLSPEAERTFEEWVVRAQHWIFGDGTHHVHVAVEDCPAVSEESGWIRDEAMDLHVKPSPVPMFWFDARSASGGEGGQASRRAEEGERVVLYFVGGGYCYGSPIEGNRCFVLAERTGLLIVGANYRKATSPNRAFPAALQDAVSAYSHLLDLGFEDIILAGDSAGGGLAMTLILYLTNTLKLTMPSLVLPSAVLLYSPWVDLSLSSYRLHLPTEAAEHDIISPSMLYNAAQAYLVNLTSPAINRKLQNVDLSSPAALGGSHPFLSPALPSSLPALQILVKAYDSSKPLRMLVTAGGAEIFAPEIRGFVGNLRKASRAGGAGGGGARLSIEFIEEKGEVHAYPLVPTWVSPAAGRALDRVEGFLTG